jgi:hypothetical protein
LILTETRKNAFSCILYIHTLLNCDVRKDSDQSNHTSIKIN